MLNEQKIILENLKGKGSLECLSLNERVIVRRVLKKRVRRLIYVAQVRDR
jgi:hypothetical protein